MSNNVIDLYLKTHLNHLYLNDIRRLQKRGYKRILLSPILLEKYEFLGKLVWLLLCISYPIILFLRIIQGVYYAILSPKQIIDYRNIYLSFSMALPRLVNHADVIMDDACCIYHNNYKITSLKNNYSIYQLLSFKDIILAGVCALKAFYKGVYTYGFETILYHLFSYHWFLTERVCAKISSKATLYFANHMDEWSVLINNLDVSRKILFQHGTLIISHNSTNIEYPYYNYIKDYKIWTYNLPLKYDNIDVVYSFTDKEYIALCSSIVRNVPKKIIVGYSTKISNVKDNKFSVLIVGEYRTHAVEEEFIIKSLQNLDINLYLKKHPVEDALLYEDLRNKYEFEFIKNNYYPLVDVVISYDSTLALEYEAAGSLILYYDDFKIDEVIKLVKNIMLKNV